MSSMTRREALEKLEMAQDVVRRVLKMPGVANDIRACIAALAEPEPPAVSEKDPIFSDNATPSDVRQALAHLLAVAADYERDGNEVVARNMRQAHRILSAVTHAYDQRGATGWWCYRHPNGGRSVRSMADWDAESCIHTVDANLPVAFTYSPAAALAWVRDGVLPDGQGKERGR